MMIESNIRKMGRLELLHTCLANLVKELHRDGRLDLIKNMEHYADPNDRNKVSTMTVILLSRKGCRGS